MALDLKVIDLADLCSTGKSGVIAPEQTAETEPMPFSTKQYLKSIEVDIQLIAAKLSAELEEYPGIEEPKRLLEMNDMLNNLLTNLKGEITGSTHIDGSKIDVI